MNCRNCGAPIEEGGRFCRVCGTPAGEGSAPTPSPVTPPPMSMPTGGGRNINNFDVNAGFSTKRIRKWFSGNKPKWPVVWTVICFLIFLGARSFGAFLPVLIFGAIWAITWMTSGTVQEVNQAWNTYVNILTQRGMEKLNLIQEEVSAVDPVVIVGRGQSPNESYGISRAEQLARQNVFTQLIKLITGKFKKEYDPEEKYRVDKSDVFHSMLLQVTVFMFSGDQVFAYFGNVDTSTGLIYKEHTQEVFYEDIECVTLEQEILKVYNASKKKRVNKVMESFVLYMAGCHWSASILIQEGQNSIVDKQLNGMRNLLRDKKRS